MFLQVGLVFAINSTCNKKNDKEVMFLNSEKYSEALVHEGRIRMTYNRSVGETGSRFFYELRNNSQIWGTRCEQCAKVFMPPRKNCPQCLEPRTSWVELSSKGNLVTYTVIYYPVPAIHPVETPYACGLILLDGADTGFVHLLGEVDFDQIEEGMRVEAVFKEEEKRQGNILDISYFKPVK